MAGTRTLSSEPPRSTAYYYADLERFKRKPEGTDELSEYVIANDVINDIPAREVPPFRDRQWSLPEYNTPENSRKGETYSTAGTFPMPEPKEKEPLLAELEVVGRLPLTQLESSTGVRRSRSWYFCCPNVGEEEISRDSSWRYSSLRPVTAPPLPGQNGLTLVATQSSSRTEDVSSLKAERDSLARALATERQRAASAARAHDARLAELHGVIAELVRRRAQDKHAGAIPEEEVSDECESTTQPAGELDLDADPSRTEQNSSSAPSPCSLPTPQAPPPAPPGDSALATARDVLIRLEQADADAACSEECDTLDLSHTERDDHALNVRWCSGAVVVDGAGDHAGGGSSCEREHGSDAPRVCSASPGRCESRQAKVASRVKLKRTEDSETNHPSSDETWCAEAAERLALDVCAQADLREALLNANHDGEALSATLSVWKLRCARLQADCAVLQCALRRAADTAHRLYCACMVQESVCVGACLALRAADRALEAYDVLLALAETHAHARTPEREAAELIAGQLLARLEADPSSVSVSSPLLSPGPWLQHAHAVTGGAWDAACEERLRGHAARLKAETVSLRPDNTPTLFSYHDIEEADLPKAAGSFSMADMEAAVAMQEVLSCKEARAAARAAALRTHAHTRDDTHVHAHTRDDTHTPSHTHARDPELNDNIHKLRDKSDNGGRPRPRHWLDTQASETDL